MDNINNAAGVQAQVKNSTMLLVTGYVSAVVSLVRYPFIFGVLGVVMGILASRSGGKAGITLILASMVLMTAGMLFGDFIFNNLLYILGI